MIFGSNTKPLSGLFHFDSESKLHYNYYRTYNPSTGRYMQSDPIGLAAGANTYNYVGFNPLNGTDPLGLEIMNLLKKDDSNYSASQKAFNPKGVLKVISHGNSVQINSQNDVEFSETIKNSNYFKNRINNNQPIIIELDVCTTGLDTKDGIGKSLSHRLKEFTSSDVYVMAPTAPLWGFAGYNFPIPYENFNENYPDFIIKSVPNFNSPGQFNVFKNGQLINTYKNSSNDNPYYMLGK